MVAKMANFSADEYILDIGYIYIYIYLQCPSDLYIIDYLSSKAENLPLLYSGLDNHEWNFTQCEQWTK